MQETTGQDTSRAIPAITVEGRRRPRCWAYICPVSVTAELMEADIDGPLLLLRPPMEDAIEDVIDDDMLLCMGVDSREQLLLLVVPLDR